ncbi:MAG: hypothetical protein CVU88_05275, partial [Firmicutes bacterium HGW-Firmicutes-13]
FHRKRGECFHMDENHQVDILLLQAVNGNLNSREQLIEKNRPFILREASRFCNRFLEWGRDEELSIALMALNEAIDAYRKEDGQFEALARLVIKRRIIDYFMIETIQMNERREKRGKIITATTKIIPVIRIKL